MIMSSSSLRPNQASSPTSSTSSKTTTPTSPSFRTTDTFPNQSSTSSTYPYRQQAPSSYSHPPSTPSRPNTFFSSSSSNAPLTPSIPVLSWLPSDVAIFLASIKCAHLEPVFSSNDITGQVILELDMNHLKEMGVDRVGDRVRVLAGLKALKKSATNSWRSRIDTGGSVNSNSGGGSDLSRRGPTVVVTRGEESDAFSLGRSGSRRLGEGRGFHSSNNNGQHVPSSSTYYSNTSSHINSGTSSSDSSPPRTRTTTGQAGHRPAPLNISQPSASTDPRLPQAYQPPSHAHSSSSNNPMTSNSSSLRTTALATASGLPRSISPNPPPSGPMPGLKSNIPRPPSKSASSSSLRALEARDKSLRPLQTYSSTTNPQPSSSSGRKGSISPAPTAPPPPPPSTSISSSNLGGLPSNPRVGQQSSHNPSNSLSGGSFTERRATLAKEREGKVSTRPSTASSVTSTTSSSSAASSSHRKTPSNVNIGSTSSFAAPTPTVVVLGANGRPTVSAPLSFHPFATAAPATPSSPSYPLHHPPPPLSSATYQASNLSNSSLNAPTPTASTNPNLGGGYSVGRGPFSNANNSSTIPFSLEDLKRKLIKFINAEDGHSRVVDLANCEGGVEVMEKVLRKFGKWNGGGLGGTGGENESDDEAGTNGLCVDGWGVFLEGYSGEGSGIPLTEAELLSICHAPPDSPSRERGLTLKRTRKLANRKAMESFFGETPPDPKSPTSPTYYAAPRLGANDDAGDLNSMLQPSRIANGSNIGAKKMNRASTVSVMSGLGVPTGTRTSGESFRAGAGAGGGPGFKGTSNGNGNGGLSPDLGPGGGSTPSARSPSAGSFLNRGRKMYNFFGHRPPSELISNHLADYFPYVQKKVLERTARNSMLRISSGSGGPGGPSASLSALQGEGPDEPRRSLPGTSWSDEKTNPSSRLSTSSFGTVATTHSGSTNSPRKKRTSIRASKSYTSPPPSRQNHNHSNLNHHRASASPPRTAIPEETSFFNSNSSTSETGSVTGGIPRLSISTDDGTTFSGDSAEESDRDSIASKPPLLPPFITSEESLSDSLGVFSPGGTTSTSATDPTVAVPWMTRERRGSNASASTSRLSMLSRYRKSRDKSDTASMLTVDEITAHVESKRVSMVSFARSRSSGEGGSDGESEAYAGEFEEFEDEDGEGEGGLKTPAALSRRVSRTSTIGGVVVQSEDGDDEEEYDDEEEEEDEEDVYSGDEDEDEEDEDEDEEIIEEDEHGKAFMSTGGKRSIKWIKGALIGSGSFGSVFLGMDAQNGLLMAVKQVQIPTGVSTNEERKKSMLSALEREIELLKELQHENIVQYLDSSIDATHLNIFLEYVPGGSVSALLGNYGAFEEALVRTFIRQTLQGLVYLHDRGIIHRDIKGANILVDNKGGIKISDFGISKKVESNLLSGSNQRKSLQGTVFWMAPEVVRQTAHTRKADIWSVGCLVVEMLTGQQPWGGLNQMQVMFKIGSSGRPAFPPDITPAAEDFLNKTFILDHLERPSAAELLVHPFITEVLE